MSAPSLRRQVDLGPGVPRMDLEPLDLPRDEVRPVVCVVCGGVGLRKDGETTTTQECAVCGGTGRIGGGR